MLRNPFGDDPLNLLDNASVGNYIRGLSTGLILVVFRREILPCGNGERNFTIYKLQNHFKDSKRMKERSVGRIIDANLNRVCEGLRVMEDIVRFACNSKELTKRVKKQRHRLREMFAEQVKSAIIERDARRDVGKETSELESSRENINEIFSRNANRVEESLRSLEEVSKLSNDNKARIIKDMRFDLYSIEKDIYGILHTRKGLKKDGIYVVLPDRSKDEMLKIVTAIVNTPVSAVQMRSKSFSTYDLIKTARLIKEETDKTDITFIVNDRLDVAMAVEADGVHIGQGDMDVKDVRNIAGYAFTIGVSTHSLEEARRAEKEGADYIAFGSIYKTQSKKNAIIQGIEKLRAIREEINIPLVAIGGINESNIKAVSSAGADYAAVMSYVCDSKEPGEVVESLFKNFIKGKRGRYYQRDKKEGE